MDIYLKSRGVSKGYSWLDESQKQIPDPPDLKEAIQIVDSDDFSIVLHRLGGPLSLLITGLESQNRTDNRTRKIRNSVLWVADESQEGALRAIAIQALGEELAFKVDRAVSSTNNDLGFQVDFEQLGFQTLVNEPLSQGQAADLTSKIGNLSELKDELIEELKQYSLPKKEGILLLVIVSPTVPKATLERNKVWRGLSDTIDAQDDWIEISGIESDNLLQLGEKVKKIFNTSPSQTDKRRSKQNRWVSLIAAFLLGLIVGMCLSYETYIFSGNNLQQTIERQQQTIERQQEKIERQQEKIERQQEKIERQQEKIDRLNVDLNDLVKEIETKTQEVKAYQNFEDELSRSLKAQEKNMEALYNRFQNDLEQLYQSSKKNSERSKKALEDQLNALENKSDSSEDKAS